ncbi:hypothetical protein SAMN05444722_2146 [Rhodovulum sp. ES.010]|uniref:hypothetical protein n=1 Tax=Rhodovulum sp. ES.010 TaxID=1882821 RepID=UPI0009298828|nr:hypothetical protein [Rhodovulum sp. ES.010]SIO43750.1 hypothetical protein SAMN05444722_2146 [Rhodovulum sp. ES.010]
MLDTLGTPVRYAIIGCIGLVLGWFISRLLFDEVAATWWSSALAGAVGGYIGGWLKERRDRS